MKTHVNLKKWIIRILVLIILIDFIVQLKQAKQDFMDGWNSVEDREQHK